jgi:hypothetical protein
VELIFVLEYSRGDFNDVNLFDDYDAISTENSTYDYHNETEYFIDYYYDNFTNTHYDYDDNESIDENSWWNNLLGHPDSWNKILDERFRINRLFAKNSFASFWPGKRYFLFCEPPKILIKNECKNVLSAQDYEAIINQTDVEVLYVENQLEIYSYKIQSSILLNQSDEHYDKSFSYPQDHSFIAVAETEENSNDYALFEVILYNCDRQIYFFHGATLIDRKYIIISHEISIAAFVILLLIYLAIGALRKTIQGKLWILLLICSLINYSSAIYLIKFTKIELKGTNMQYLISLIFYFTEYLIYICLNVLAFKILYMISSQGGLSRKSKSKRMIAYILIGIILPIIVVVLLLYFWFFNILHIAYLYYVVNKSGHSYNFHEDYENLKHSTYLPELIIKTVTFFFFIGSWFLIWRNSRNLRNLRAGVHTAKKSISER